MLLANVASFNYCTSQSPTDPNLFNLSIVIQNNTSHKLDLSHTVVFSLEPGTQPQGFKASAGDVNLSPSRQQLTWHNFQLAPGQSASLSIYLTKAATSLTLVSSINVTGVDLSSNTPFTAILPQLLAQPGIGQDPIYPLPTNGGGQGNPTVSTGNGGGSVPNLPHTGAAATQIVDINPLSIFAILLGTLLSGGCLFGLIWYKLQRSSNRR